MANTKDEVPKVVQQLGGMMVDQNQQAFFNEPPKMVMLGVVLCESCFKEMNLEDEVSPIIQATMKAPKLNKAD